MIAVTIAAVLVGGCSRSRPATISMPVAPEAPPASTALPTDPSAGRDAADAEAARRAEAARLRERLATLVFFGYDRADLDTDARAVMREKATILREHPEVRLRIDGHADERGSVEYNLALSLRRAATARGYLVDLGIDPGRIEIVAFGEERALEHGTSDDAYARNRRAEFVVLSGLVAQN